MKQCVKNGNVDAKLEDSDKPIQPEIAASLQVQMKFQEGWFNTLRAYGVVICRD